MFNRFKKFISLILCAALLNACVLPSTALFAAKSPVTKRQQVKSAEPQAKEKEAADKENPTITDTWQKLKNFEWKELNRADAWNMVKVAGGTVLSVAVAYALFKSKHGPENNPNQGPKPNMPGDTPNPIPVVPITLQDIITNDLYEPGYKQKVQDLCNTNYRKQLQKNGFIDLQNQLIQEIGQTSNPAPDNIKNLIDRHHEALQKHLENGNIINQKPTDSSTIDKATNPTNDLDTNTTTTTTAATTTTITKEEEKPKSLYPFAEEAQKNNALVDVTVPEQKGLLCAIHALYDGNYINEKFMQDNTTTVENLNHLPLLAEQISQERANANFSTHCENWTGQTARKRKADASEKYISYQLHRCIPLTEEEQSAQSGFFNYIFSLVSGSPLHTLTGKERNSCNLIASIVRDVITHNENPQDILLWDNSDTINLEDLYNVILNLANQCHRNLDDIQRADLHAFINALDTAQLKANFNGTLAIDETKIKNHAYYYHQHLSTDFTGENLDSEELEILIEQLGKDFAFAYDRQNNLKIDFFNSYEQEDQDLHNLNNNHTKQKYNLNGKISIINNTANMAPDSRDGTIIAVIKHQMSQCNKFVHTFMIRLGAVKVGSASSTHWISVTVVRSNNKNHYFITDSYQSPKYVNQANLQLNIKQLVNALEQPHVPQLESAQGFDSNNNAPSDNGSATNNNGQINTDDIPQNNAKPLSQVDQEFLNALGNLGINNNISIKSTSQKNVAPTEKSLATADQKSTNTAISLTPSANPQKLASIPTIAQSGNSCAYHALKNADDILQLIHEGIPADYTFKDVAIYIGNSLCNTDSQIKIATLFNEQDQKNPGEWRQIIKTKRLPDVLKESIYNKLLQSIPRTEEQITQYDQEMTTYENNKVEWDKRLKQSGYNGKDPRPQAPTLPLSILVDANVRNCLRNIAHACATQLSTTNESIVLTNTANLQETLMNVVRTTNPALLENSGETDHSNAIALLNADELAKNFGDAITEATAIGINNPRARELIGNDLADDELQLLFDNGNVENRQNISIIARANTTDFTAEKSYALSDVIDVVKVKIASSDTCSHAFLIRSGFSRDQAGGTHWICVVLYRFNSINHYIIADSYDGDKFKAQLGADVNYLIRQLES